MPLTANAPVIKEYANYLLVEKGLAKGTCAAYRTDLGIFAEFLESRNRLLLTASDEDIRAFLGHLRDHGVHTNTVGRKVASLRGLYKWLLLDKHITKDPTEFVEAPSKQKSLPKPLGEAEVKDILNQSGCVASLAGEEHGRRQAHAIALRDHAILELLYATGMRVTELVTITTSAVDLDAGRARVRGKGDKDRLIPIGRPAIEALKQYLAEGRPHLFSLRSRRKVAGPDRSPLLFLSYRGMGLRRQQVGVLVEAAKSEASPHRLRHSCATHMVDHGADIRSVQIILGHSDIGTTEVYTKVAPSRLASVIRKHHPRGSTGHDVLVKRTHGEVE